MTDKQPEFTLDIMKEIISNLPVFCDHSLNIDHRCFQCNSKKILNGQLKKLLKLVLNDVIGENEKFDTLDDIEKKFTAQDMELIAVHMRNKLRELQRTKLKQLMEDQNV